MQREEKRGDRVRGGGCTLFFTKCVHINNTGEQMFLVTGLGYPISPVLFMRRH